LGATLGALRIRSAGLGEAFLSINRDKAIERRVQLLDSTQKKLGQFNAGILAAGKALGESFEGGMQHGSIGFRGAGVGGSQRARLGQIGNCGPVLLGKSALMGKGKTRKAQGIHEIKG